MREDQIFDDSENNFKALSQLLNEIVNLVNAYQKQSFPEGIKKEIIDKMLVLLHFKKVLKGKVLEHIDNLISDLQNYLKSKDTSDYESLIEKCVNLKNNLWNL
jgi:hypothetical protein